MHQGTVSQPRSNGHIAILAIKIVHFIGPSSFCYNLPGQQGVHQFGFITYDSRQCTSRLSVKALLPQHFLPASGLDLIGFEQLISSFLILRYIFHHFIPPFDILTLVYLSQSISFFFSSVPKLAQRQALCPLQSRNHITHVTGGLRRF